MPTRDQAGFVVLGEEIFLEARAIRELRAWRAEEVWLGHDESIPLTKKPAAHVRALFPEEKNPRRMFARFF